VKSNDRKTTAKNYCKKLENSGRAFMILLAALLALAIHFFSH